MAQDESKENNRACGNKHGCTEMKYKVTEVLPDEPDSIVVVSIEMSAHDWYVLKSSRYWSKLIKFYDGLQKLNNRQYRQEMTTEQAYEDS